MFAATAHAFPKVSAALQEAKRLCSARSGEGGGSACAPIAHSQGVASDSTGNTNNDMGGDGVESSRSRKRQRTAPGLLAAESEEPPQPATAATQSMARHPEASLVATLLRLAEPELRWVVLARASSSMDECMWLKELMGVTTHLRFHFMLNKWHWELHCIIIKRTAPTPHCSRRRELRELGLLDTAFGAQTGQHPPPPQKQQQRQHEQQPREQERQPVLKLQYHQAAAAKHRRTTPPLLPKHGPQKHASLKSLVGGRG